MRIALVCVAAIAVSCSSRPVDPVGTFAPKGTLQGTVVDSYDQLPVEGAKITINYDGHSQTITTDASGTFSFVDIPASSNPNSAGGASGTYSVNLDLKSVKGDRVYKQFRSQQVAVQFTELRRADTTNSQTSNAVQDSTPVSYLVSNLTFTVRQARAVINGTLFDEQLKPKNNSTIALVSRSNSTSVPNGATVATATSGNDGKFSFTAIEEGAVYQIVLPDQNVVFAGGANNYQGTTFTALELGVVTVLPPVVLAPRPASDPTVPYVTVTSPSEDAVLAAADATKPIVLTFSEPMNVQRGLSMVTGFRRIGPRNRPDDPVNSQLTILFDKKWDTTGTIFTITPTTDLEAGFRYQIDFNNQQMADIAGNIRSRVIPYTQPQAPDALSVSNGLDDLVFAIGSDSTALTVAAVNQEPDTADNANAVATTRASVIESDPSATESSFLTAQNAGFYTANRTDHAYITWAAPSSPVRRYRVWTRVGMNNPILISRSNNVWGVSSTRLEPLAPNQTAFNMPLSDLSTIYAAEAGGLPQVGLPNTTWNNGLSVQLGVSVVNADGQEGDIVYATLRDNTAPAFARGGGFGMNGTYLNSNDTVLMQYTANCSSNLNARVVCPKIANAITGMPAVTSFGQRLVQFDLSEPVDAASVITANVDLVDDTLANNLGVTNPNTNGGNTEADATISSVVPLNVVNGRTTRIGVVFNNFFGLDTGDKVVLKKGTAAIKDISGNAAKDGFLITAPVVDDYPPMIKSVSVDPAADTITLTYTKWFSANQAVVASQGNIALSEFNFTNFLSSPFVQQGSAQLLQGTKSFNGSGEQQVVLQFTDVGYVRGYNSTDANCMAQGKGTRISSPALTSIDFSSTNARSSTTVNDDGVVAYENVLADPVEPAFSPGAYQPVNGVGTRSSVKDTIAPRLSNGHSDRTLGTFSNAVNVGASSQVSAFVDVAMTEFSANESVPTAANSAYNAANWSVAAVDLGVDNWVGNAGTDPAASGVTVTVDSVSLINQFGGGCARTPRYRLNLTVKNTDASAKTLGFARVTVGPNVTDLAGNAIGTTGRHAKYAYSPTRTDANGNLDPGWVAE